MPHTFGGDGHDSMPHTFGGDGHDSASVIAKLRLYMASVYGSTEARNIYWGLLALLLVVAALVVVLLPPLGGGWLREAEPLFPSLPPSLSPSLLAQRKSEGELETELDDLRRQLANERRTSADLRKLLRACAPFLPPSLSPSLSHSLDRQADRQTDRQTERQTDRQRDEKTDRQTDKQTDRNTDRQTDLSLLPALPPISPPNVLLCIVGHVRTFGLPAVYKSLHQNLLNKLRQQGNLTTFLYLVDPPVPEEKWSDWVCPKSIEAAIQAVEPDAVKVELNNTCSNSYFAHRKCREPSGYLSLALVDRCFRDGVAAGKRKDVEYTHFVRARPDLFVYSIPSLKNISKCVSTSPKSDASGNDQFFIFCRELYRSWWGPMIEKLDDDNFWTNEVVGNPNLAWRAWAPEFFMFHGVCVNQLQTIVAGLMRPNGEVDAWVNYSISKKINQAAKKVSTLTCTHRRTASPTASPIESWAPLKPPPPPPPPPRPPPPSAPPSPAPPPVVSSTVGD